MCICYRRTHAAASDTRHAIVGLLCESCDQRRNESVDEESTLQLQEASSTEQESDDRTDSVDWKMNARHNRLDERRAYGSPMVCYLFRRVMLRRWRDVTTDGGGGAGVGPPSNMSISVGIYSLQASKGKKNTHTHRTQAWCVVIGQRPRCVVM